MSPRPANVARISRHRKGLALGIVITLIGVLALVCKPNPIPSISPRTPSTPFKPEYAGSATCAPCHRNASQSWKSSHHALAERPLDPERDREPFARAAPPLDVGKLASLQPGFGPPAQALFRVLTNHPSIPTSPLQAERVLGHDPLRQYLVPFPGGRLQATAAAWDPSRHEWFNAFGTDIREPGDWGHWSGRGMNWNSMCATCHNTGLSKNYRPPTDDYATTMTEFGVGCETCHGPMAAHVRWQQNHPAPKVNPPGIHRDPTLNRPGRDDMFEACGSCHSRRSELTGRFLVGERFDDHFGLTTPDLSDGFHPDGQIRDEDYEFAPFLGSRMHARGVRCVDCHDPHSGKILLDGNALCLRCHQGSRPDAPKIDPAGHSHHPHFTGKTGSGGACVDCHMPQTTYMERHPRHDHGFTIPDPKLTLQAGVPNACNRCHTTRNPTWADQWTTMWYGSRMNRPSHDRTLALALARLESPPPEARDRLLRLLSSEPQAYWRAVLLRHLLPWTADPLVPAAATHSLLDSNAWVRAAAVELLSNHPDPPLDASIRTMLRDPSRSVRVAAAWALRGDTGDATVAGQDLHQALELNADQPQGQLHLGQIAVARGDLSKALAHLHRVVEWDPASATARQELAVLLSTTGDLMGATQELEAACRIAPRDGESRFRLGLIHAEREDLPAARSNLQQAVELAPRHSRAWYNLALVQDRLGQWPDALTAILRAESIQPNDATYPYTRAILLIKAGRKEDAAHAANRALELNPGHAGARDLANQLAARP